MPPAWLTLYEPADLFRTLTPWRWMYDSDVFGVRDPATGQIGWCSVTRPGSPCRGCSGQLQRSMPRCAPTKEVPMPRSIQIHLLSLFVGIGFALLGLVAMGQMPAANRPESQHDSMYLQVAHPRDWVVIEEGAQHTVPAGKPLVLTALGNHMGFCGATYLDFNGVRALTGIMVACSQNYTEGTVFMESVPVGLRASSGDVVSVAHQITTGVGRAWGYLVDA